jgi:ABC-type transporter Mla MlaB component
MASSPKQPGFLTKMVGLIRASAKEPERHDGDSVQSRQASDQALEKEAIREHIERRRRDDQIRRREFNYLRKVRAQGLTAFPTTPQRPSVFQNSSSFNPDAGERRRTVRKIDAIEAQMSTQWAASKISAPQPPKPAPAPRSTRAMPLQPVAVTAPPVARELPPLEMEMELDLDFTGVLAEEGHATQLSPLATAPGAAPAETADNAYKVEPPPVEGTFAQAEHPVLHEAATCFAAGDDDAAEAALLSILESPESGDAAAEACSAGLLDLYRATGQQSDFDVVAIEYAQLFGRSAPEWFSVDEVEPTATGALDDGAFLATHGPEPIGWTCPAQLTLHETASLQETAGRASVPVLHWGALQQVAAECIAPLRTLFQQWASKTLELQFSGVDVLLRVLAQATAMEDRSVDPAWWNLRLEVLRTLNQAAVFDEVALDFCVTYEVSPPSWTPPLCRLVGALPVATTHTASALAPLEPVPESRLSLSGVLQGDAALVLAQMLKRAPVEDPLIVSCARLVRVDFVAAVSLLNWVTNVTASGRHVQFVHVPRLLAAYFDVVGISAQARVLTGKN